MKKLQYGDIIQFKPVTAYGEIIRVLDGSPYSHTAFFWKYVRGIPLFLESHKDKGGVVVSKLQEWGNYDVYRPIDIKPRPEKEMLEKIGTLYDTNRIVDILVAKIAKKEDLANNNTERFICSEYTDYGYYYQIGGGIVATPKTFYESKHFIKII